MKLFISWSGEISHKIAVVLRDWIPAVIPSIAPWVSSEDIPKGTRWGAEVAKELADSFSGIICVVPDNIREPWLLFEVGALSRSVGESRVFPLLFGVKPSQLPEPLAQFQATTFEKEDVRKLMQSLNNPFGQPSIPPEQLDRVFEYSWLGVQAKIDPLLKKVLHLRAEASKDVSESTGTATPSESVGETVSAKQPQGTHFHPMEIEILRTLYAAGELRLTADAVARALKCEHSKAMYYLDRLQDRRLIEGRQYYANRPEEYSLTKQGRAILIEKDLI